MSDVLPSADEAELFRRARRIGFEGVELILRRDQPEQVASGKPRAGRDRPCRPEPGARRAQRAAAGSRTADRAVAETAAADVRRALDWAVELGADAILIPFFGRAELRDTTDVRARRRRAARRSASPPRDRGVSLLYEGTLPAEGVRELAALVGLDRVRLLLRHGERRRSRPRRRHGAATRYCDLVRRVHVKDVRAAVNDCPPGLGLVDFGSLRDGARRDPLRRLDRARDAAGAARARGPRPLVRAVGRRRAHVRAPSGRSSASSLARSKTGRRSSKTAAGSGLTAVQLDGQLLADVPRRARARGDTRRRRHSCRRHRGLPQRRCAGRGGAAQPTSSTFRAASRSPRCSARRSLRPRPGRGAVSIHGRGRPRTEAPQALDALDESLGDLLAVAERHGSILALEASVDHVVGTMPALQRVLDRFPTRSLQVRPRPLQLSLAPPATGAGADDTQLPRPVRASVRVGAREGRRAGRGGGVHSGARHRRLRAAPVSGVPRRSGGRTSR